IVLAAVVMAEPMVPVNDESVSKLPGRDIMFALDYSGSMVTPYKGVSKPRPGNQWYDVKIKPPVIDDTADGAAPAPTAPANPGEAADGKPGEPHELRRIDAAQSAILDFVDTRRQAEGGDAIGLIVFDYRPILRWPLDHDL